MNIFTAVKYYCILHGRVCVMVGPDLTAIMGRFGPILSSLRQLTDKLTEMDKIPISFKEMIYLYTTQSLIRSKLLILYAGVPAYLIPNMFDRYVAQL